MKMPLPWTNSASWYSPAWNIANKHEARLELASSPQRLKPKDPTPTLTDLKKKKSEGRVRCFNYGIQREIMKSSMDSNSMDDMDQLSMFGSKQPSIGSNKEISTSLNIDSQSTTLLASKQRMDAIIAVRQQEEQRRMNGLRAKMRAMAKAKEDHFMATYEKLQSVNETFIADLDKYLENKTKAHEQKQQTLYSDWKECVFDKIQAQLLYRVEDMNAEEIGQKRRQLFQNYIDASRRKGGRLFLDIVIENEYDPFTWKKDSLRFRNHPALLSNGPGFTDRFGNPIFDPLSRDLDKLQSEARAAQEVAGAAVTNHAEPLGREILGHEHWSKMEATPFYDRAAKVQDAIAAGKSLTVRNITHSNVDMNEFEIPSDNTILAKEFEGLYGSGKRVWKDWQPGSALSLASETVQ